MVTKTKPLFLVTNLKVATTHQVLRDEHIVNVIGLFQVALEKKRRGGFLSLCLKRLLVVKAFEVDGSQFFNDV